MLVPCTNCKNSFDPKMGKCLVCKTPVDPNSEELRVALTEEARDLVDEGVSAERILEDYRTRYGLPEDVLQHLAKTLETHAMQREVERYKKTKLGVVGAADDHANSLWSWFLRLFGVH